MCLPMISHKQITKHVFPGYPKNTFLFCYAMNLCECLFSNNKIWIMLHFYTLYVHELQYTTVNKKLKLVTNFLWWSFVINRYDKYNMFYDTAYKKYTYKRYGVNLNPNQIGWFSKKCIKMSLWVKIFQWFFMIWPLKAGYYL